MSSNQGILTRRRLLQAGALAGLNLTLPKLLAADQLPAAASRAADSAILIFLNGGPSHLDTWDMKPSAAAEIRGQFKPIASSLPGVQVCEHLPRMAKLMHHTSVIRSAHHSVNNSHAAAVYAALTGHDRGEAGGGTKPTDHPAIGSVVGKVHPPKNPMFPFVSMPYITKEGAKGPPQPGFFGGFMGSSYDPLFVLQNPNDPGFKIEELTQPDGVSPERFAARQGLLRTISPDRRGLVDRQIRDLDRCQQKAFELLTSPATQQAFRIDQEAPHVRDAYGRNIYGQSVLLARRLIEAGTRVATISWAPDANATWDTHGDNFGKLKNTLLPELDAAVSALLEDLLARRMLERTLVVVMGEFGRTPKINAGGGRDHWNFCYSLMMAGGGIKGGHVYGSSDAIGGFPASSPTTPADIVATIYHTLGVSNELELRDGLDRPFALVPWGNPIRDILESRKTLAAG